MQQDLIYTSNYASISKLGKAGIKTVQTSLGTPKWCTCQYQLTALAPRGYMLRLSEQDYTPKYHELLENLKMPWLQQTLYTMTEQGTQPIALLCFCDLRKGFCHRRLFADWFERKTGYIVPEFGESKNPPTVQAQLF